MNIEEFVDQYCVMPTEQQMSLIGTPKDGDNSNSKKLVNMFFGGQCQGNKDFKTFYLNQPKEQHSAEKNSSHS